MGMDEETKAAFEGVLARLDAMEARLMTRINDGVNHLQTRMDGLDEHLTLGLGHGDDAMERAQSASNSSRIHGEQIRSLQKLVRSLEARIRQIEEK
jgi:hypothetical protein